MFVSAERVVRRDGAGGLTSRAVTTEAGVAKGVMHHHFADFDAFLAELVLDRTAQLDRTASVLCDAAGSSTVVDNLADALRAVFTPLAVAMIALVVTRDGLRTRLGEAGAARFPMLVEGCAMVTAYLRLEQARGRVAATADVPTLSRTLIGSAHLLFTDREGGAPDPAELRQVVGAVLQGGV